MSTQLHTPADHLYDEGIPLNTGRIIQHADITISSPVKAEIDWEQDIIMDEATQFATMSAVSHYHYVKTSNVLLCDTILADETASEPERRAAQLLLKRNGEELQAWSKYVEQAEGCGPMGEEQREYYHVIWNQDGIIPTLLGVQHINLAADTSYKQFDNTEPVFQQMTDAMLTRNEAVYPEVNAAFHDILHEKSRRERLTVLRQVAQQIDLMQLIVRRRSNTKVFNVLDTTDMKLAYGTGATVKDFYRDIGLTNGLLPDLSLK